jgi:cold-inducible RNA-binding protein
MFVELRMEKCPVFAYIYINLKTLMKVFIAGLPLEVDEAELTAVFGDFGPVKSLRIIKDRETKESKGFGFVEMVNDNEAKEAIRCMNGASYYGRRITVNIAEDKGPGFNASSKGSFRRN